MSILELSIASFFGYILQSFLSPGFISCLKDHFMSGCYKGFGFSIKVSSVLDYKIGEIQTNSSTFSVMFLRRKDNESGSKIELLAQYRKMDTENQSLEIDQSREEWMELCNAHQSEELVKQKYTTDAYYYNRGRLLQGTKSIAQEVI